MNTVTKQKQDHDNIPNMYAWLHNNACCGKFPQNDFTTIVLVICTHAHAKVINTCSNYH